MGQGRRAKSLQSESYYPRPKDNRRACPKTRETDFGEEIKYDEPTQCQRAESPAQSPGAKETMIAEPIIHYVEPMVYKHNRLNIGI